MSTTGMCASLATSLLQTLVNMPMVNIYTMCKRSSTLYVHVTCIPMYTYYRVIIVIPYLYCTIVQVSIVASAMFSAMFIRTPTLTHTHVEAGSHKSKLQVAISPM